MCNWYVQADHNQSQILLKSSEKFGLLLAENLNKTGSSVTIESENIGKTENPLKQDYSYNFTITSHYRWIIWQQ